MKIGIVVRILWSAGTQKFAIEQARALQEEGHHVTIIFLRNTKSGDVYAPLLDGLDYKIMTQNNSSRFVWLYDFLTGIFMPTRKGEGRVDYNLLRRLPRYVRDMNFDYIICQDQWAGLGGYYCKKKQGIRYAVVFHEQVNNFPWVKGFKRFFVYMALRWQKKIVMNADRIFTMTEAVAKTINDFYKGEIEVVEIFPGLKNNVVHNYLEKKNQIVLISYWNEVKIPEAYIPIFKGINGYKFVIAGNWISSDYMNKFIDKLTSEGAFDKVTFQSNMSEGEKTKLLHESKFYMRFGQDEKGPGYGTIEAIEAGIPIICNTGLGIADYLKSSNFALVMDNIDKIERINQFLTDTDDEDTYNKVQSEMVQMINEHSWHAHASKMLREIGVEGCNDGTAR